MTKTARLFYTVIILTVLLGVVSCSGKIESFPTVVNQGILALSTTNPYSGANLFLAKESENSSYLFNFLEQRGAPTALEVIDENFEQPRILLFYPKDKEVWTADRHAKSETEWVVSGPFAIQRHDYRELSRMVAAMNGEPVFNIFGKEFRFRSRRSAAGHSTVLRPTLPAIPLPSPTAVPKKKPPVIKRPASTSAPEKSITPGFTPLNTDQMAILMAQGFAERSATGDVIHTVRSQTENVEAIVEWYTGSKGNVGEVRQLNRLGDGTEVSKGTRISIPLKMVKNTKAYSAAGSSPAPSPATPAAHH